MLKFQEPSYISFSFLKEVLIGDILEPLLFYIFFFLLDGMGWNYSASYNLNCEKKMKINARFSGLCFEFAFFCKESEN